MTQENGAARGSAPRATQDVLADTFTVADLTAKLSEVDRNADDWWKSCALAGVEYLAATGTPFVCADLADVGVPDPDVPARWGAAMNAAARSGLIVRLGYGPSTRPTVHRSVVAVWIGAQHAQDGGVL